MSKLVAAVAAVAVVCGSGLALGRPASFSIQGSGYVSARATCSGERLATGGGYKISSEFFGGGIVGLHPKGRGWRTALYNNLVLAPLAGRATAICGGNRSRYDVVVKRVSQFLTDGARVSVRARCPGGTTLAGGGAAFVPPTAEKTGVTILSSRPARGKWAARFEVRGATEFRLRSYAVCDRTEAKYVTRRASDDPFARRASRGGPASAYRARAACPSGGRIASGGFAFREGAAPRKIGRSGNGYVVKGDTNFPGFGLAKVFARCLK